MEYTGTQNQAAEPLFDYPMDSPSPLAPIADADADADADLPAAPEQGLAPSLERLRLQFYLVQVVVDVAILLGSFAVANLAYSASVLSHETMLAAYLLLPLFQTIAFYNSTYSRSGLTNWRAAGGRALAALLISAALLNFIAFFAKMNADFSRVVFTGGLVACGLAMIGFRWIFARYLMRKWGHSPVNRLLIEAGGPDVAFADVHRVDAEAHGLTPDIEDPDALDRLAKYLRNMDQVIVSCRPHERTAWASVLKGSGIHGEVVSGYAREIGAMGIVHHAAEDVYTILISRGHLGLRARAAKRLFDIAVSLAGLVLLAPVMLLTAMAIKLGDGGPVLFSQKRMGRGNRFFTIHKFRTMHAASGDATGSQSASKGDQRITRIGRFLRRSSIDELPQLFNVLLGDMSIVGPRPHALGSQAGDKMFWQVDRKYWQRHGLRPGITGLAQVRGFRGATDHEHDLANRLQADLEYMRSWSLLQDMKIIASTLGVLVHDRAF